jgi:hypothetical protein
MTGLEFKTECIALALRGAAAGFSSASMQHDFVAAMQLVNRAVQVRMTAQDNLPSRDPNKFTGDKS